MPLEQVAKTPTSAPKNEFSPLSLVRMVWKQFVLILGVWIVLSIVGLGIVYKLHDVYRAETLVLVESQKIPENFVASTVNAELQDRLATISQQILSSTRLKKIIDKFNLYADVRRGMTQEDLIEKMRKDIHIKLERGWTRNQPGAFRISYMGSNAEVTAAIANDISNLFIEENLRSREVQASGTSEFIEGQLQNAKKSLEEQENKLAKYKQEHNGQLPEQEQSLLGVLDRLRTQLQGNQESTIRAQSTKQMLESALESAESSRASFAAISPASSLKVDPVTGAITSTLSQPLRSEILRKQLDSLRLRYTDAHPLVKQTWAELALVLDEELKERDVRFRAMETAKKNPSAGPELTAMHVSPENVQLLQREQERISTLKTQLTIAKKDVEAREAERHQILASIADYQARVEKLPMRQQEMASLTRDYEFSKENYKTLLNKNFAADIASDMEKRQKAERFTVLDNARVPEKPYKPNRLFLNVGSVIAALIVSVVIGCAREWKKNVILGEWEIPGNVPVLGRIPTMVIARIPDASRVSAATF